MITYQEFSNKYGSLELQALASFDVYVNQGECCVVKKKLLIPYPYWVLVMLHKVAIKLALIPIGPIAHDRALKSFKGASILALDGIEQKINEKAVVKHFKFFELASDKEKIKQVAR